MNIKKISKVLLLTPLLIFMSLSACKKSDSEKAHEAALSTTIRVGEVGSMTGSEATFGTSTHQGIELAFKKINAAGGVKGKKLELFSLDDQSKPDEAATAATNLITQKQVVTILGEVASSRSLAMAPIAQQNQIPLISPASTNPKVTEQGDYIFRVCFIDPFQGSVMAKFAAENLGVKNVAILRDVKSDYSMGLANFFTQTFQKMGGSIALDQSYSSGDIDFKSQLTAIRATNPEAIFIPGYYTEVGLIARQARELGITVPFLGGDGWDSPKLYEIGGTAINGSFFSNHYSSDDTAPAVQDFVKEYKTVYNETPSGFAALGYDAAMVLADALNRATSLNTSDIRDALALTKDYKAVTGNITIDDKRNAVKAAVVLKVDGAGYKFETKVNP